VNKPSHHITRILAVTAVVILAGLLLLSTDFPNGMHSVHQDDAGDAHHQGSSCTQSCHSAQDFSAEEIDLAFGEGYYHTDSWDNLSVGGYASKTSVVPGESLDFHISTAVSPPYTITIWREGAIRQLMATVEGLTVARQVDCTGKYGPPGCGWPVAHTFQVPASWPSGVYSVDIPTAIASTRHIVFWVREDSPGSTSPILFLSSVNTYQAYNTFGGKSLYDGQSTDGVRAYKMSLNRPFCGSGLGDLPLERSLIHWAESEGYAMEYAASSDLEFIPDLLSHYEIAVIAGHSEYWTWDMRQRLRAFIHDGGRFINLSGNTMWWQVRFEDDGRTLVCYKDYQADPATVPSEETDIPVAQPICDAEYAITGVQWLSGGNYGEGRSGFVYDDGYGGYWVQRTDHWIFAGTGLQDGDVFGRSASPPYATVIGAEMDGTTFNCAPDGRTILGPLGNTGTPHNFTILGIAPVDRPTELGFAVMGIYTVPGGGAVFSASSTGWSSPLQTDAQVAQVTRNVFERFLANDVPAEPVSSSDTNYFFYDRFNCNNLDHNGVRPSYTGPRWYEGVPQHNTSKHVGVFGDPDRVRYTNACGVEGAGLELTMPPNLMYTAQVKPNWQATDVLYTRLYLDFSNLYMREGDSFDLLRYLDQENDSVAAIVAKLRVRWINGRPYLKHEDRASGASSPWAEVPTDRPFLLETMWNKPANQMTIWVDDLCHNWGIDLSASQLVNRVDLVLRELPLNVQGSICVDEFALNDARIGPLSHASVTMTPDRNDQALPGSQVILEHTLTNTGNAADSFDLSATSDTPGWTASLSSTSVGPLQPGESASFSVTIQVPQTAPGNAQTTVTIQARSQANSSATATVRDTIAVMLVQDAALFPAHSVVASAGSQVVFNHTLLNAGNVPGDFELSAVVDLPNWSATVLPASINLPPGASTSLVIKVQVPDDALDDQVATINVTASWSGSDVLRTITDQVTVINGDVNHLVYLPIVLNQR